MGLQVILADDDKHIRMILRKALLRFPDIDIVGEASTGQEAVALVEALPCDCVFTDIEMPGQDGVTTAQQILKLRPDLFIVFVTAHPEYMPQAFEMYATDYLVKPFHLKRLEQTVKRIQTQLDQKKAVFNEPATVALHVVEKIYLKTKDGDALFNPLDIYFIERENRQTTLILKDTHFVSTETLTELEARLPKEIFMRSHRSYIINVNHVYQLLPYGRWTFVVKFDTITKDALITSEKAKFLQEKFHWSK